MQQDFEWASQEEVFGDDHGMPPAGCLFHAIKNNDVRKTQQILQRGFDPNNYWIGGKSFLRTAGENGNRSICELLVQYGADPNEANGKRNYALLHNAAVAGNYGFASILLDLDANPSPLASNRATPLHIAARTGQEFLAKKLIECGADVDVQDSLGQSPLLLAFKESQVCVAKLLIKKSGNLSLPDKLGNTPRMVAEVKGPPYSDLLR